MGASGPPSDEHRPFVVARWIAKPVANAMSFLEGPVVRNASSLYGTTIVTSALGFVYWFVAAKMVPVRAVGLASAIQSATAFLSILCVIGLSTLLISELARDRTPARSLMLTATVIVAVVTLVLAPIVGLCLQRYSTTLRQGLPGPIALSVFTLLTALTCVALVLDDACIGLLRGDLQLRRNAVFSVSKLLLLPLLIVLWPTNSGTEMVVAWLAGVAISLVTLALHLRKLTSGQSSRLNFSRFIQKRRLMVGHHWLNLAIQSPRLCFPVLVATIVGPLANAGFTVAQLVVSIATVIPYHLSTVLFALAPGDEVVLRREIRKTMRLCLILAIGSAPFFALFSGVILGFFGHSYETAAPVLAILGLTIYPSAIKFHYVAIARVRGRMQQAAFLAMIGASLEVGLAAVGGVVHGETGLALGILFASLVEGALFSRVVFGVLRIHRTKGDDDRR
jgi:O-antigen/teichoic acid export membrane protein